MRQKSQNCKKKEQSSKRLNSKNGEFNKAIALSQKIEIYHQKKSPQIVSELAECLRNVLGR